MKSQQGLTSTAVILLPVLLYLGVVVTDDPLWVQEGTQYQTTAAVLLSWNGTFPPALVGSARLYCLFPLFHYSLYLISGTIFGTRSAEVPSG